jgi:alpha-L-rhamnosidase
MLEIAPVPVTGMNWVKADFNTPHGPVQVAWHKKGKEFTLEVNIPANTKARIVLPGGSTPQVKGSGNYTFTTNLQ